jgi:hypothetical protein
MVICSSKKTQKILSVSKYFHILEDGKCTGEAKNVWKALRRGRG